VYSPPAESGSWAAGCPDDLIWGENSGGRKETQDTTSAPTRLASPSLGHSRGELQLHLKVPGVQGHPDDLKGDEQFHLLRVSQRSREGHWWPSRMMPQGRREPNTKLGRWFSGLFLPF
jgi:hypothetical protein